MAIANSVPQQRVPVLQLGDGYVLAGVQLVPTLDEEGNFCVVLAAICGRESTLVPIRPVQVFLGEVGKVSLESLKARVGEMLDGPKAEEASP